MDWLSLLVVAPLELCYRGLYELIQAFVHSLGLSLLVLSVVTVILMVPLERCVHQIVAREKQLESILTPQVKAIQSRYKGAEQHAALKRLYQRYRYSPLYSVRSAFGVLIQIPFLMGAYWMLSDYTELQGVSFGPIQDLSKPDGLLMGVNLLPIIMTAVNLLTVGLSRLSRKESVQATVIAIFFLVILYDAPSALLVYWTSNNVLHCLRSLAKQNVVLQGIQWGKSKLLRSINGFRSRLEADYSGSDWCVLLILSGLTPACILWFSNIGFFSPEEIASSLWGAVVIMLLVTATVAIIRWFCRNEWMRQAFSFLVVGLSAVVCYKNSSEIIGSIVTPPFVKGITALASFYLLLFIGRMRMLNIVLTVCAVSSLAVGVYDYEISNRNTLKDLEANTIAEVKLKETPNIYYVLCESMHSLDIAKDVYGFDGGESFRSFLEDRGFYVPSHVYSNSDHTLGTLSNIFSMTEQAWGTKGALDTSMAGRQMIAGGIGNNLLAILKANGYRTSEYFKGDSYFYKKKGPLLDYTDINVFAPLEPMRHLYFWPFWKFNMVSERKMQVVKHFGETLELDSLKILSKYLSKETSNGNFFFHRLDYTNHTETDGTYHYREAKEWVASHWYRDRYREEVEALKAYTDQILEKDPDAVIVYIGDHGAWRYRVNPRFVSDLDEVLREIDDTYQSFVDDRFKVFGAVRLPSKYGSLTGAFSPANVFAKIFQKIGYEGKVLREAPNVSYGVQMQYLEGRPVVKDDKVNDDFR